MRKEIGKVLRDKFHKVMLTHYPNFKRVKTGIDGGDRGYSFRYSDQISFFIVLSATKNDYFDIILHWSCDHQFRYGLFYPLPNDNDSRELIQVCPEHVSPRIDLNLDHSDPLKFKTQWDFLGYSLEEFRTKVRDKLIPEEDLWRSLDQFDPVELCISRIDGCLQQVVDWIDQYGMPYLLEVAKIKTLT